MSERFIIKVTTETFLRAVEKDLSRVRQWIAGFEAAGGRGPAHSDALWRAQQILGSARRDTDGSPRGPDPQGLDGEAATAGAEGIAQPIPTTPGNPHDR